MFSENKYTRHFATHKNAQSQLVTVQCSLSKCQREKSKVQLVTPTALIWHKIPVALQHLRHKLTQYSVSWPSPNVQCNMNSPPWPNTRATQAEVQPDDDV